MAASSAGGSGGNTAGTMASSSNGGAGGMSSGGGNGMGASSAGGSGGGAPMLCGNGVVDPGEVCDDGNNDNGDGCDATCSILECVVPLTHPSVQAGLDDNGCAIVYIEPGSYAENLYISRSVTLIGTGPAATELNGAQQDRTVLIGPGHQVAMHDLTITGGMADMGAGIMTTSDLTLLRVIVQGNHALGTFARGGGVLSEGAVLTLDDTTVQSNIATGTGAAAPVWFTGALGAGVASEYGQVLLTNNSHIDSNVATANGHPQTEAQGAGLFVYEGSVTVQSSTISGNLASITTNPNASPTVAETALAFGGGVALHRSEMTLGAMSSITSNMAEVIVASSNADGSVYSSRGGGIYLYSNNPPATLTATDATITSNQASVSCPGDCNAIGGGIYARHGNVSLSHTTLSANTASASSQGLGSLALVRAIAGGAYLDSGTSIANHTLALIDSTVAANQAIATTLASPTNGAYAEGGGIALGAATGDAVATLNAQQSTLSGNYATSNGDANGGGISAGSGTGNAHTYVLLTNSTVSGNNASGGLQGWGGAVHAETGTGDAQVTVELSSATVTQNHATSEGGGLALRTGISMSQVQAEIRNSILALNTAASDADCYADDSYFATAIFSILGAGNGCPIQGLGPGLQLGVDPLLGPLQPNGGPTRTHALSSASPAINSGDPTGCDDHEHMLLSTDQRGMTRITGPACDLGAYEHVP